jgi:predicted small lipoprotein YifL
MRSVFLRAATLALLLAAAGCGQKGPLYLPDRTHASVPAQPATPPATSTATTAPEADGAH